MSVPRLEYKYLVPIAHRGNLRKALLPFMTPDEYLQSGERADYTVRSVYLDTPDLECFHEKLEGVALRKKYRIRGYDRVQSDSIVFLEIKKKTYHHVTKSRAPLLQQDVAYVLNTGLYPVSSLSQESDGTEQQSADQFLFYYYRKNLRPVILIVYEREAFIGRYDRSLRVTLDKNIRSIPCSTYDFHREPLRDTFSRYFILEVKFRQAVPPWVPSIIRRFDLQRTSVSKYAICMELHKIRRRLLGSSFLSSTAT
ncbi:polyphosphate polymerase domain-containing protein [bacterium]|nr:polyphosphate polymerase domain-containing protein [bacterium]